MLAHSALQPPRDVAPKTASAEALSSCSPGHAGILLVHSIIIRNIAIMFMHVRIIRIPHLHLIPQIFSLD